MSRVRFDFRLGTHHDAPASGFVGFAHAAYTIYISPRREIGCLDVLHQPVRIDIAIVDVCHTGIDYFRQVVCRHICRHTYRDAGRSVYQQIGDAGRHHRRFLQRIIEIVGKIHRFFIQVLHHVLAYLLQARFSVTHGCRAIAVYRTEVPLSVYQRITHSPVLCHTHQGSIYGRIAMRVVFTQHFADDSCGFLIRFV